MSPHGFDEVPEHIAKGITDAYAAARAEGS
jgi:hypothetical protein